MPHFYDKIERAHDAINKIPIDQLVILDKQPTSLHGVYASVYQDFKNDIMQALESGVKLIMKYRKLVLVFPKIIPYPLEIETGFRNFCQQYDLKHAVISEISHHLQINAGEAFIVIEETDLINLIKISRSLNLVVGKNIGIISYNETPLKGILLDGITVIYNDHEKMGETAANLI
ncbi:MAG: substrate-binding domain-containing protein, partial [Ferruginibacter sp.]